MKYCFDREQFIRDVKDSLIGSMILIMMNEPHKIKKRILNSEFMGEFKRVPEPFEVVF